MSQQLIAKNSTWGIFFQLSRGILGFIFVPFLISTLGLTQYGIFSILMLFSFYQGIMNNLELGYFGYLTNSVSAAPHNEQNSLFNYKIGTFNLVFLALYSLFSIVILTKHAWLSELMSIPIQSRPNFKIALVLIILTNYCSYYFSACSTFLILKHKNSLIKKIELASYLLFLVLSFILLKLKPTLVALVIAYSLSQMLLFTTSFGYIFKYYEVNPLKIYLDLSALKKDLSMWKPFFWSKINGLTVKQSDITIISFFLGPEKTAVYDLVIKIPSLLKSLFGRINEVLAPVISQNKKNVYFITEIARSLVFINLIVGFYLFVFSYFWGTSFLTVWLNGQNSPEINSVFVVASLYLLFVSSSTALATIVLNVGQRKDQYGKALTLASSLNIFMSIGFTYTLGIKGTLLSTFFQFTIIGTQMLLWLREDLSFKLTPVIKEAVPSISAIFLTHLPVLALNQNSMSDSARIGLVFAHEVIVLLILAKINKHKLLKLKQLLKK